MNFFKKAPTVKVQKVNKHEIQKEPGTPHDQPGQTLSQETPVPIDKEMRRILLEQQRQNDRELRKAGRDLDRDKANLEREEKKLEMEIKKMAKEGNNEGCKILAKQLVQLRKQKTRIYAANSKIASVQIHNKAMGANIAIAGAMGTTAKTMGNINKVMNPHQIAKDMEAFKQANAKMDMTDEMISDTLDDIMDESGDEQESEGIVNQVLDEIGIEISGKMADAPSVARNKLGESTNDADRELMAQLAKLKS